MARAAIDSSQDLTTSVESLCITMFLGDDVSVVVMAPRPWRGEVKAKEKQFSWRVLRQRLQLVRELLRRGRLRRGRLRRGRLRRGQLRRGLQRKFSQTPIRGSGAFDTLLRTTVIPRSDQATTSTDFLRP